MRFAIARTCWLAWRDEKMIDDTDNDDDGAAAAAASAAADDDDDEYHEDEESNHCSTSWRNSSLRGHNYLQ